MMVKRYSKNEEMFTAKYLLVIIAVVIVWVILAVNNIIPYYSIYIVFGLFLIIVMINTFRSDLILYDDRIVFTKYFGFVRPVFYIKDLISISLVYSGDEIVFDKHTGFKFNSDYEIIIPKSMYEKKDMIEVIKEVLKRNKHIKPTHDLLHYLETESISLSPKDTHTSYVLKEYKIYRYALIGVLIFYTSVTISLSMLFLPGYTDNFELTYGIVLLLLGGVLFLCTLYVLAYKVKLDNRTMYIRNIFMIQKKYSFSDFQRKITIKNKESRVRQRINLELKFKDKDKKLILRDVTSEIVKHLEESRFSISGYMPKSIR